MSLPGKLCVGILEEDNPLKAYFRFKPLLVAVEGGYEPYTEGRLYPEEGCIRIVPDKNEAYHFKARMRRIGLFCVVDLREHPGENNKIRPNKNYRGDGAEQNAFIIYSDVVREPAADSIFEILPAGSATASRPAPHNAGVLLREGDGLSPACYAWEPVEAEGPARLVATGKTCAFAELRVFDLPGFRDEPLSFALLPPDRLAPAGTPKAHLPAESGIAPVTEAASATGSAPVTGAASVTGTASVAEVASVTGTASVAEVAGGAPVAEAASAVEVAGTGEGDPARPWLSRDESMLPPPVNPRLSPAQRLMAAQAGLNPRRGRSLQELIDEKWQRSRLNQLGHPVAPLVTGEPLVSPLERAVDAVRDAWAQPDLRQPLLESLGGMEEFGASLQACREAARQSDIERHLNALEARRLALMGEMDRLKAGGTALRAQLMADIRREESEALAEAVERTAAARAEQSKYEAMAEDARAAARDARSAVEQLAGDQLERQIRDFALNRHVLERLELLKARPEQGEPPLAVAPADAETLLDRVQTRFAAAGRPMDRTRALNLCACAALAPTLILSGAPGSGKAETARLLAEALGLAASGRFAAFPPGMKPLDRDARVLALERQPEVPALLLLENANLHPVPDPMRGLGGLRLPADWRLCLTVQDAHSGHPLTAGALDAGFMLRLSSPADAPWQPAPNAALPPLPPIRPRDALAPLMPQSEADVPTACAEGMAALRRGLADCGATPSRRALDDAWRYCGVMAAGLGEAADPVAILDLAVAQRLLPGLLASAPVAALRRLPALLRELPASRALLELPLPILI